jgi:hypothetical protein
LGLEELVKALFRLPGALEVPAADLKDLVPKGWPEGHGEADESRQRLVDRLDGNFDLFPCGGVHVILPFRIPNRDGVRPTSMVHGRGAAPFASLPGFSRDKVRARHYIPSGRCSGILS